MLIYLSHFLLERHAHVDLLMRQISIAAEFSIFEQFGWITDERYVSVRIAMSDAVFYFCYAVRFEGFDLLN